MSTKQDTTCLRILKTTTTVDLAFQAATELLGDRTLVQQAARVGPMLAMVEKGLAPRATALAPKAMALESQGLAGGATQPDKLVHMELEAVVSTPLA